jgi:hypothetical protein
MSLKIGIVGLSNVGKSTLFNALVKAEQAEIGDYPFTTIDPNVAVVPVPDENLKKLQKILQVEKNIPATIEFVDIAGLIKGAHKGEGLGNQFLDQISAMQAILIVLRAFKNESVAFDNLSPKNQLEIILDELGQKDRLNLMRLIEDLEHKSKVCDEEAQKHLDISQKLVQLIDEHKSLGAFYKTQDLDGRYFMRRLHLSLLKPRLILVNVSEHDASKMAKDFGFKNKNVIVVSARTEKELNELSEKDQKDYLKALGIADPAFIKIIKNGYKMLNLITFYTYKPKELVQAWTLPKNKKVLVAAAKIHTDFAKNFIRAEVIKAKDLLAAGSMQVAMHHGKVRAKGKEYLVVNGDIVYILHS